MHGSGWDKHWQHRGGPWGAGPPPWVSGLLNLAQPSPGRGPKVRRGDVRAAILDVLAVEPMNGYQIIQQIAERSGGAWKPSPGSVYPTVQQLEDEGLVEGTDGAGRRLLRLTDQGRAYVDEHPDELAATWRSFDEAASAEQEASGPDLKPVIGQVMGAVWQVVTTGTRQQQAEAAEI
ncbi:MAG TPA: PadR family transcriptional regulator, partial [Nocardioidaceae bacterium]|nr:PadR family transcriptional regulator [Nocardioidaceae bacterium]